MAYVVRLPKPTIELTLEEGGSLAANTTYYFSGYYNAYNSPYYCMINSAAADQVSITTTSTAKSIRIKYKWDNEGVWDYGYPPYAVCVDTRWDLVTQLDAEGDFQSWQVDGGSGSASYGSYRWVGGGQQKINKEYLWTTIGTSSLYRSRYRSHQELSWKEDYYKFPSWADRKAGALGLYLESEDDDRDVADVLYGHEDISFFGYDNHSGTKIATNVYMLGTVRFLNSNININRVNWNIYGMLIGNTLGGGFSNSNLWLFTYGNWTNWYGHYKNTKFWFRGIGTVSMSPNPDILKLTDCEVDKGNTVGCYSPNSGYRTGDFTFVNTGFHYNYPKDYDDYGCYMDNIKIINSYFYVITINNAVPVADTYHTRFYNCEIDNSDADELPTRELMNYSYNAARDQELRYINLVLKTIRPDETIEGTLLKYVDDNRPKLVRSQVSRGSWYSFWHDFIFTVNDLTGNGIAGVTLTITNTVNDEITVLYTDENGEGTSTQRTRYATPVFTTTSIDFDWFDFEDFTVVISKEGYSDINLTLNSVRTKQDIRVTLSPIIHIIGDTPVIPGVEIESEPSIVSVYEVASK